MVPLLRTGIAWYTDKNIKYRNPSNGNMTLAQVFNGKWGEGGGLGDTPFVASDATTPTGTAPPPYWHKPVYQLDPLSPNNNGFINDDLIVWMREAAFPNFKKLYGVLRRAATPFTKGLPAGNYSLNVSYSILQRHVF